MKNCSQEKLLFFRIVGYIKQYFLQNIKQFFDLHKTKRPHYVRNTTRFTSTFFTCLANVGSVCGRISFTI